jgi:hypothetical protein
MSKIEIDQEEYDRLKSKAESLDALAELHLTVKPDIEITRTYDPSKGDTISEVCQGWVAIPTLETPGFAQFESRSNLPLSGTWASYGSHNNLPEFPSSLRVGAESLGEYLDWLRAHILLRGWEEDGEYVRSIKSNGPYHSRKKANEVFQKGVVFDEWISTELMEQLEKVTRPKGGRPPGLADFLAKGSPTTKE